MTAKEFIENTGVSVEEPYSYYNQQWLDWMQEYARIKCLDAIRNTRHKACDILTEHTISDSIHYIHNIPNQDVMPEL